MGDSIPGFAPVCAPHIRLFAVRAQSRQCIPSAYRPGDQLPPAGLCRLRPRGHSTGSWAHGWPRHPSRSRTASFLQALVRAPRLRRLRATPVCRSPAVAPLFVPGPVWPAVVGSPSRRPDCTSRWIVGPSSSDCPFLAVAQSPSRRSSAVTFVGRAPGPSRRPQLPSPRPLRARPPCPLAVAGCPSHRACFCVPGGSRLVKAPRCLAQLPPDPQWYSRSACNAPAVSMPSSPARAHGPARVVGPRAPSCRP